MTAELPDPTINKPGIIHHNAGVAERAGSEAAHFKSGSHANQVVQLLARLGDDGATDWEIIDATGILRSSLCAVRNRLMREGWVEDSGKLRIAQQTGVINTVWRLTTAGRKQLGVSNV